MSSSTRPDGGGLAAGLPSLPGAACVGTDLRLWFGPDDEDPKKRQQREAVAVAFCRACPVRLPCLAAALAEPSQVGVRGGVGEYRRKSLRNAALKRAKRAGERAA